ncbi:hypothetical protein FHL15_002109 [Xylaria flabelliformis]|uniref:Cell wall protein n=1 Tax=Xylaria flabelliformis TaxID=2512241 RepID=A0A553I9B9_9PEZI|nr:hypothetical protein FHL15_002109 [Xylaria flabelliformis]
MQFTKLALAAFSLGSAVAAPVVGDLPALTDALAAVGNVKTIVQAQVATVTTLTQATPAGDAVTKIEASLQTIGQNLNGLVTPLLALAQGPTTGLSATQLASVSQLVSDCQTVVEGVQTVGKTVVSGLGQDALNQVQPELQWVLSTAGPIVKPLISFTTTAVPGTSAVYQQVNSAVGQIQGVANTLIIAPVNGVVGGVLGGVL